MEPILLSSKRQDQVLPNNGFAPEGPTAPKRRRHECSAASIYAARAILNYFDVQPKKSEKGLVPVNEYNLAATIDVTTNTYRVERLRSNVHHWQKMLKANRATSSDIEQFLRELGVALDSMPHFSDQKLTLLGYNGR